MSRRIMNLPYVYETRLKPPRCRNYNVHMVRDLTPVSVTEVSAAEAPIAIELRRVEQWQEATPEQRAQHFPDGPPVSRYRVFDGRLYLPVSSDKGFDAAAFEEAAGTPELWRSGMNAVPRPFWPSSYPAMPALKANRQFDQWPMAHRDLAEELQAHQLLNKHIVGSTRAHREVEAQELLTRELLIVDNQMWSAPAAWEPFYRVITKREGIEIEIVLNSGPLPYASPFRLDMLEQAIAFAETERLRVGAPVVRGTSDEVDVLIPSALCRDNLVLTAEQALSGLAFNVSNRQDFEPWPPEAQALVEHLYVLRGAKPLTPEHAVDALEAISRFADIFNGMKVNENSDAARMIRDTAGAVHRWKTIEKPARPEIVAALEELDADFAGLGSL